MFKNKPLFITFEGIEGSGKSFHSKLLYKKLKKLNLPVVYIREPGGNSNAEAIRKVLLSGKKNKFDKTTDALLILAARNENILHNIKPNLKKNKIIICDRFVDSTLAYQVNGFGVNKTMINSVHKEILGSIKVNFTFVLNINLQISKKRILLKKDINRYDKFTPSFYNKVQKSFLLNAKKNKKRYMIIDTSKNIKEVEKIIFEKILLLLKK
ncbi:MAG: dTMP kinase [Candidatus Pelagibacter sp. TMED64]|nr:dTMP kinase [Candidatus Pelagibacter sp.]OUU66840.1 MAG: dTMP kinase [Candidatus Pelagibacter sp. TMED64]